MSLRALCPHCGHAEFRSIGQPGRAECKNCHRVCTHAAALAAGQRLISELDQPLRGSTTAH